MPPRSTPPSRPRPTTVITARYGFNRFPNFTPPISLGFNLTTLGLPSSLAAMTQYTAFPSITMSDLTSYGGGTTAQNVFHSKSFNTTLSKFMGRHTIKAGYDYRLLHHDGAPGIGPSSFSFSDVFTRANPKTTTTGTGASLSTMLLGYPTGGSMTVGTNFYNYVKYSGVFVQDDFRVTSRLTLNFGFRMEHETGPADSNNKFISGFDPNAVSPLQAAIPELKLNGTVLYAGLNGNPTQAFNAYGVKIGPRFGFAYSASSKMSIRGGYGIFWAPLPFSFQSTLGYSQSTPIITSIDNNFTPAASLDNPYPNGLLAPAGNSAGGSAGIGQSISVYDRKTSSGGYVEQFSLDVQRQLKGNVVLSAGFIGSRGIHLVQDGRNLDQLDPKYLSLGSALNSNVTNPMYNRGGLLNVGNPTISQSQLLLPFPQFTGVTVNGSDTNHSRYDALYAKVQRRFSAGMTLLATYTWSRNHGPGLRHHIELVQHRAHRPAERVQSARGVRALDIAHAAPALHGGLLSAAVQAAQPHPRAGSGRLEPQPDGRHAIRISAGHLAAEQQQRNRREHAASQCDRRRGRGRCAVCQAHRWLDQPGGILPGPAIHLRQCGPGRLPARPRPDQLRYFGLQGVLAHGETEGAVPRGSAQHLQYADLLRAEHDLHQSPVRHHHQPGQLPAVNSDGSKILQVV